MAGFEAAGGITKTTGSAETLVRDSAAAEASVTTKVCANPAIADEKAAAVRCLPVLSETLIGHRAIAEFFYGGTSEAVG